MKISEVAERVMGNGCAVMPPTLSLPIEADGEWLW